ncbi:MAG: MYXO-CTERM sorting domain-containing protein [Myxococcota bacterium]|nr:MYXO-CTERM sorting domain-containing protein [Myxococcota bacterium]
MAPRDESHVTVDGKRGGCAGCASGPGGGGAASLLLLAVLGLLTRRRRLTRQE